VLESASAAHALHCVLVTSQGIVPRAGPDPQPPRVLWRLHSLGGGRRSRRPGSCAIGLLGRSVSECGCYVTV